MEKSDLVKKDVLLTGATGVIGAAIATRLLQAGYRLHLTGRTSARMQELASKFASDASDIRTYECELEDRAAVTRTLQSFFAAAPRPFGLICNAGNLGAPGPLNENIFSAWVKSFGSNFFAHAQMIHFFANEFKSRGLQDGRIVVMSGAGVGIAKDFENISSYSTAKAALTHLVEAIAPELQKIGIAINAVAPGAVNSGMTLQALNHRPDNLGKFRVEAEKIKSGGGVSPTLAADMVELLLRDSMSKITGRLISARFDKTALNEMEVATDNDLFRLRRIDEAKFGRRELGC